MSLMIEKHPFDNLSKDVVELPSSIKNQNAIAKVTKEKEEPKDGLTEIETLRKSHELSRRKSVKIAVGLLQVSDIINNLEGIAKGRNNEGSLGFRCTKEIKPDDMLLGQIASTISEILKIYPSSSNIQVAVGFIEMVDLIDELENMANANKGDRIGFDSSVSKKTPLQVEALKYAENLRTKIPYLMEWLEVPEYMLTIVPSKN